MAGMYKQLGNLGACSPEKMLRTRCPKITFETSFGPNTALVSLLKSYLGECGAL